MVFDTGRFFLRSLIWRSILISLSSARSTKEFVFPSKVEKDFGIFQQWMKEFGRIYPNSEESKTRYQIFQRNLSYITGMNAKRSKSSSGYYSGLNMFADMSPEEFKSVYLPELNIPTTITPAATANTTTTTRTDYAHQKDSCGAPASMDWRKSNVVTGVK
ncbi:P34 probable thiol protease-like [Prosopis cineraria]|uniref:P34 probable thiol protease-like n=1 Tax=Prosopis cineraria TaxID=364024 RepID=UPI0024105342|nr:P34 probable thiol protease-like [Prosopis cineraria]